MLTVRRLPPPEWSRLVGTELEHVWPLVPVADTDILVVEEGGCGGSIVGCWAVIRYTHVEGLWIHPDHRKRGRVGARLYSAMISFVRGRGVKAVLTGAVSDEVRRLITHAGGTKIPADCYVLPIGGD